MARVVNIGLAQLSTEAGKEAAFAKVERIASEAAERDVTLLVLPDLSFLPFFPQFRTDASWMEEAEEVPDGPSCRRLGELARANELAIVASVYERARDGVYYDTAVAVSASGEVVGKQRMMHIPEEPDFNEKYYYKPGNSPYPVFELAGARVGVAIGQDLFFPEHHRLLAIHGAELVVVPNAIAADTDPLLLCSQAAAVSNHLFVAVANRIGADNGLTFVGKSHVSSPTGDVVAHADPTEQLLTHAIDLDELAQVRRTQNYWLRDRRPETYGDLIGDHV
jgi:beta-ureidopropionase